MLESLLSLTLQELLTGGLATISLLVLFFKKNEWVIPFFKKIFNFVGSVGARNKKIDALIKELSPNGGSSMKDAIGRIETKLVVIENTLEVIKRHDEVSFDLYDMATFKTDAKGSCVWVSKTYQRMSGMNSSELQGDGWVNVIYGEDRERVFREWSSAIAQKRDFHCNFRYQNAITKDVFNVEVHALVMKSSNNENLTLGWMGHAKKEDIKIDLKNLQNTVDTLSKITIPKDNKDIKDLLDETNDLAYLGHLRSRQLMNASNEGIFECSIDGECIYSNSALQKLFGLSYEGILGRGWLDGIHYEDKEKVLNSWQNCVKLKLPYYCEYTVLGENKDNLTKVYAKAKPFIGRDGKILLYHGYIKPI